MELEEAIKICQTAIPKDLVKGQGMWHGYEDDELLVLKQAIDTVLAELDTLQMNYKLLEEKFDGSAEEKVDKLTEELDKQTESYEKGYRQGYNEGYMAGAMEII